VPRSAFGVVLIAAVPAAGLSSDTFEILTELTKGGLLKMFCSKVP
jgi:hypothetical protein